MRVSRRTFQNQKQSCLVSCIYSVYDTIDNRFLTFCTAIIAKTMDKITVIAFNPVAKDILLTVSSDRSNTGIRVWNLNSKVEKLHFEHGDMVFDAAWSSDGQQIATVSKSKKIKVFDASHDFNLVVEGPGHQSLRPAKLLWLGDMKMIASVGFGLGSSREVLVYKLDDLAKGPCFKKNIDISPSVMSAHFDPDCGVLYAAGRVSKVCNS
jgi:coronin-7